MTETFGASVPQILVVDDTPQNLQIVGETLSRTFPCDLSFATDGRQALESIKESPPALILLDVMMPGMSGFEVCKTLKADPRTAEIPVLFLTAKTESADVVAGFEMGAADYIAKPFNPHELIARVKAQLDLRRAEAERLRLETQNRMLQKHESLTRMAGAIAHHFNNQLQILLGYLELASCAIQDKANPEEFISTAIDTTSKASELGRLMLTYLGQAHCRLEAIDLSESCRRILSDFQSSTPDSVRLEIDLPSPGPLIQANAQKIGQLFLHLLSNARESLEQKSGAIQISLKPVDPSEIPAIHRFPIDWAPTDSSYVCLKISDTGCGIPSPDLDKIFDPFFTTHFTGRGMGLPVVLGITRSHGAAITVQSEPNLGTTLCVFFPVFSD